MSGKIIRFWPLIAAFTVFAIAWGALGESVREHHKTDDDRCKAFAQQISSDGNRITALEVTFRDVRDTLSELKQGQRELLRRNR